MPATAQRFSFTVTDRTYSLLKDMSHRSGKSVEDTLGDAIALAKLLQDVRRQGYRVLLERNGRYDELLVG